MKKHIPAKVLFSLPNLLTLFNLFTGFLSMTLAAQGHLTQAAWLILLALVWDSLDGNIARIFKNPTAFGRELDSLADIVSFIVAPVFLASKILEPVFTPWQLLFFFIFLACGAVRLARFNLQAAPRKGYFSGLPSPAAALTVTMLVLAALKNRWDDSVFFIFTIQAVLMLLGGLMCSRIPYPKFSALSFEKWRNFYYVSLGVFFLMAFAVNAETALLLVFALYVVLSPPLGHWISPASYPAEPKAEVPNSPEK